MRARIELGAPEDLDIAEHELDEPDLLVAQLGLHGNELCNAIQRARIAHLRGDPEAGGSQRENPEDWHAIVDRVLGIARRDSKLGFRIPIRAAAW